MKQIPSKAWLSYIGKLRRLNTTVANCMQAYVDQYGVSDSQKLIDVAYGLVTKYGEGSAALASEMYDALAELQGAHVPAAEPAETASTAKWHAWSTRQKPHAAAQKRGEPPCKACRSRHDAEKRFARRRRICMGAERRHLRVLHDAGLRGWQRASKKAIKNGHAEHIHANCDCTYAIRFDPEVNVEGYDPDAYLKAYRDAGSDVNELRRIHYAENRERINAQKRAAYAEQRRRKTGEQGQEIIDKPTYNKLTKDFLKHGGLIIRGEEAVKHLEKQGAYASYFMGGNFAFIRDDATVSDVLEEMYHALQDRKNMFAEYSQEEMLIRREIDAQKYLISVAERYKIPIEETNVTKQNLANYEERLKERLNGKEGQKE